MRFLALFIFCTFFSNITGNEQKDNFSKPTYRNKDFSIVFVHIGQKLPPYLETSILQANLFNKNAHIYLIASEESLREVNFKILENNIHLIPCESLKKSENHILFLNNTSLLGFWRYTTQRFFYLSELIDNYNLTNVFHLENDNMLYMDLEKHLTVFEKNYPQMIAATFDSDERCIAGFMYIADKTPIDQLCSFLAQQSYLQINDMYAISNFKNKFFKIYIDHLPILSTSFVYENELFNLLGKTAKNKYLYCNNFEKFNSIFDAAAIGQYLGGIHLNPSKKGFINETCLFTPDKFSFEWEKDEQDRQIPYIHYKNEKYRINNLHIHSKKLKDFYSLR